MPRQQATNKREFSVALQNIFFYYYFVDVIAVAVDSNEPTGLTDPLTKALAPTTSLFRSPKFLLTL